MRLRHSILHALRWDVALLLVLGMGLGLYLILKDPYIQPATQETIEGSRPPDRTEGDVLLLLPDTPSGHATAFADLDCSYGWFNALWQEYGSFASALNHNLSPEILAGRSVVIVPRRVAEAMPPTGVSALESFVRAGGELILEAPRKAWAKLVPVGAGTKTRQAGRITSTEGLDVHGPMREHLPDVPLVQATFFSSPRREMAPAGPVLFEVDGLPGMSHYPLGEGKVFVVHFDAGCVFTSLQQGLPRHGMSFAQKPGPSPTSLPTSARTADESMLHTRVPYADLLERALLWPLSQRRPLPRLWYFPGQYAGALLLAHPAPENIRGALGFADWSRRKEGVSTIFGAVDRLTPTHLALAKETRAELGLLWVQGHTRPPVLKTLGAGALRPFAQELALKDQLFALDAMRESETPLAWLSHTERSLWHEDWDQTFQQLAHARVRMDTSFGPSTREQAGYLFGTGFPFYPLDAKGLPLPLLEQPFLFHEGSLTRSELERALENSESYFHQNIAISIPAHAMLTQPSAGTLLALRDTHDLARAHNHWIATHREMLEFLYARRNSIMTSQWSPLTRRLTVAVNLLGSPSLTDPGGVCPGLALPARYEDQEIDRVMLDGKDLPLKKLTLSGTGKERILALTPGRHTLSVYYAPPPETDHAA